jgi:hypothetical protein
MTREQYYELLKSHLKLIEDVEEAAQADYQYQLKPMSADEWQRARESLQEILRWARREIGQP